MVKSITKEDNEVLSRVSSDNNPSLVRLSKIDPLGRNPNETLTELSNDEGIIFSLLEAAHEFKIVDLPATMFFFERLRINRVPLNRKGIDEYLKAIIGQPVTTPTYGGAGSLGDEEKKPGIISRIRGKT